MDMEAAQLLEKLRLSNLQEISKQAKISRQTLYNFLNGENTTTDTINKLSIYFQNQISNELYSNLKFYGAPLVDSDGARFENMVAVHLLKMVHFYNDTGQADLELKYLRTKDQHEIDFIILSDRKPLFTVEVKLSDTHLDSAFKKFQKFLNVPHFQIVKDVNYLRAYKQDNGLMV